VKSLACTRTSCFTMPRLAASAQAAGRDAIRGWGVVPLRGVRPSHLRMPLAGVLPSTFMSARNLTLYLCRSIGRGACARPFCRRSPLAMFLPASLCLQLRARLPARSPANAAACAALRASVVCGEVSGRLVCRKRNGMVGVLQCLRTRWGLPHCFARCTPSSFRWCRGSLD
jgi:hypothetical protein